MNIVLLKIYNKTKIKTQFFLKVYFLIKYFNFCLKIIKMKKRAIMSYTN